MTKPVAIIPARGGSKRIPRKNIVDMNGLPMLAYPIKAALKSGLFSDVIVSTEDSEIAAIAAQYGARVIERPLDLASDTAMEIDVYEQVLSKLFTRPDYFCAIYPTAILIEADDLQKSFTEISATADIDVLMSVSPYAVHPYKALINNKAGYLEMVHPAECVQRSQTYPHYVASNGTFYWFRTTGYEQHKSYYPSKMKGYVLPTSKAIDIDEPGDLALARAILSLKK